MKVLDLQCCNGHSFEGWFASEQAFVQQHAQNMVACPVCASVSIQKMLSAPRLNLSTHRRDGGQPPTAQEPSTELSLNTSPQVNFDASLPELKAATAAWLEFGRKIVATTADVGSAFAEEARSMHYGETQHRAIRGTSTREEAIALLEEGVPFMPLLLPEAVKGTLQ